jgi:WD40 repeat protein
VTAGEDGGCRVWDAETGRPITPWLLHKRSVSSIAFAPDGRRMVTACVDGTACIWDTVTGEPLSPVLAHKQWISCATFDAEGRRILTGSNDRTCRIWELPIARWPSGVLQAMAQLASGLRVDDTGGLSPIPAHELRSIWQTLQETVAHEFTVTDSDEWNWHRLQAADAASAEHWSAARFHLEQMLSIRPSDAPVRRQLLIVEGHLNK